MELSSLTRSCSGSKIIIEPLMREKKNIKCKQIQCYCFNGVPKLILAVEEGDENLTTLYDENLNIIDDVLSSGDLKANKSCDKFIKQSIDLSKKIVKYKQQSQKGNQELKCEDLSFIFVRVDWIVYKNKLYFEEMTFTPYSGFQKLNNKIYLKLSNFSNILQKEDNV